MAPNTTLNEQERTELLDWVRACESSYHIDSTPGHRFGGLPSNNQENRDGLVQYVDSLLHKRLAQAVPILDANTVMVYGIKNDAVHPLGVAPMPMRMKARELAREQFGQFEDGDGSDADLCFGALEQLIEYISQAHQGPANSRP